MNPLGSGLQAQEVPDRSKQGEVLYPQLDRGFRHFVVIVQNDFRPLRPGVILNILDFRFTFSYLEEMPTQKFKTA